MTREVALRQRLEVQQAVAAALAAPTPAPPAVAAPEAPDATTAAEADATAAAEAEAAADAEANAMLPDEDGEDAGLLAFANADAADAAVNAAAEAAELAAADTEVETDTEAPAMTTAFSYGTSHAAGTGLRRPRVRRSAVRMKALRPTTKASGLCLLASLSRSPRLTLRARSLMTRRQRLRMTLPPCPLLPSHASSSSFDAPPLAQSCSSLAHSCARPHSCFCHLCCRPVSTTRPS